jgi:hypothetical protein
VQRWILLTVIEPYHIKSSKMQDEIDARQAEAKGMADHLARLSNIQEQLAGTSRTIEEQPWTDEIETLKRQFRTGQITNPVAQSDAALDAIATKLERDVIAPLRTASNQLLGDNPLAGVADALDKKVATWLARYKGTNWWITRDQKDDTAEAIGQDLAWLLRDASKDAADARERLERTAEDKTKELNKTQSEVDALVEELTGVMNDALPAWARGMIDVKQLLILFPWLLAGIAAYLLVTAVRASRHFHAMADGEGWSDEERRDPLLSTAWTLSPRGLAGSIATFMTYGLVLAVLAACLYRSQKPPTSADAGSVRASVEAIAAQSSVSTWLAYLAIAAAFAIVVGILFREFMGSESSARVR